MSIHHEVTYPVPPERVYELLTNGAKFGEATGQPGKGGGAPGAYFSLFDGWVQGRQIELVPSERIVQAWRFTDWDPGVYSIVRFTLFREGDGTRLVLDQDAVPEAFIEHVRTNWPGFYLEPMEKYFDGQAATRTEPVEVTIHVNAPAEEVFSYFTDPLRYVTWMGSEAYLEPKPGGIFHLHMSDGMANSGIFLVVEPPRQVVFTWGFANAEAAGHTLHDRGDATSVDAMPPGSTRVTVTLEPESDGTRLTLRHDELPNAELREGHDIAWNTYLPRLVIAATGGDPGPDPHA
jgi:uncharacterized protein YndB with AHSA1/START domain